MSYYHQVRTDIKALLPRNCSNILDVGAGAGATLRWIKTFYPGAETTGVDINPAVESELKQNADFAIIGSVDECFSRLRSYDLILFLDVLEHLVDPAATLARFSTVLRPGGHIIVSVPNIAHLSVSVPLLFARRFAYQDAGLLDRTHLRFFVEASAVQLLNDANFVVKRGLLSGLDVRRWNWLNRISFGLLRHKLTRQYIMLGELTNQPPIQQPISWSIAK